MSLSTMDDLLIDNLSFWFDELDDFDTSIPYLPDELTGGLLPVPEDPIASLGAPAPTRKPVAIWKPDADRDHRICIESSQMVPDERWRDDNKLVEPISERETCKLTPEKETEEERPGTDSIGRAKGRRAGRRPEKSRGTGLWRRGEIGTTDIAWRDMERQCSHCRVKKTPQWRTGPRSTTLCNACGMRYKSGRLVPEYRPAASPSFDTMRHSNFHKKILKLRSMRY